MKKLIALFLSLMLCLSSAALAESVPSKTTEDMTKFEVVTESGEASGFYLSATDATELSLSEIEKLKSSESVAAYFGEVKDAEGNVVDLTATLGTDTLNVHEFLPVIAFGYEETMGKVTANLQFSTPYAEGEEVIVMIGIVESGTITWTACKGIGVTANEAGCIKVELTPELVLAIQNGTALLSVVSK